MTEPKPYQINLNRNHTDILQLICEGYTLKIEPGQGQDDEGDTFTFRLTVLDGESQVAATEAHIFAEAMAEIYGSTPER